MKNLETHRKEISDVLFGNFIPFWEEYSPDKLYGGFLCGFDREGNLFYQDKSVWQQGRLLWMFAKLYNEVEHEEKWLQIAKDGYNFINKYCFDENGHMYFRITRDGKPLVNRRYYFSEAFAIMGYVELYIATKDEEVKDRAIKLFEKFNKYYSTPGYFPPKVDPKTRRTAGHSIVMIMLNLCQYMRRIDNSPIYDKIIDDCIFKLCHWFIKPSYKALFETVGVNGEQLDSPEGRLINPGHSLETAWFLIEEAFHRKDHNLMETAIEVTMWSLERGWDKEMGGIFYMMDVEDKPVLSLEWDMKLLWPHCEAMIALLYAYKYDKNEKYLVWFERIKNYIFEHFPDGDYPEWLGHLHRDGTPINYIKGSDWKGPYHNVRAFLLINKLLKEIQTEGVTDFGKEDK